MSIANFAENSGANPNNLPEDLDRADRAIRELIAKALNGCKKRIPREEVAQQLTERSGERITKSMLDDFGQP